MADYYWSDSNGKTHVMKRDWIGVDKTEFGYSSLCDEGHLAPVEGQDFELAPLDMSEVRCDRCRQKKKEGREGHHTQNYTKFAVFNGHLVGIRRHDDGSLLVADRACGGSIEGELDFNLDEAKGDLHEQVETVCDECWQRYTERQWDLRAEGGQIKVTAESEGKEQVYHADKAEAGMKLYLTSIDGLETELGKDEIEEITYVPARQVDY